jgi:ketosteroid isomerase-like protein
MGPGLLSPREVVERFGEAFNRHDVDAVMALSTEDTVLETTLPAPDGRRLAGQDAVRAYWEAFFRASPHARFEPEETIVSGDRCVVRWVYRWIEANGTSGHVRGVDVFRVRDGKVAEKLVYVKG